MNESVLLSDRENALYIKLNEIDTELGDIYMGAVLVLNSDLPNKYGMAAYGLREVNYYRLKPVACLVGCKPTKARLQP